MPLCPINNIIDEGLVKILLDQDDQANVRSYGILLDHMIRDLPYKWPFQWLKTA